MIRTLRIKFVMINMILVFLVLAAVFGALCVTSYRQVVRDNEMTLRMAASRAKEVEPPKMEVGKEPPETFVGAPVFVVQFDAGGNFMYVRTENMYIEQDEAAEIAQAAREAGGESGVLPEYQPALRRCKQIRPRRHRIHGPPQRADGAAQCRPHLARLLRRARARLFPSSASTCPNGRSAGGARPFAAAAVCGQRLA